MTKRNSNNPNKKSLQDSVYQKSQERGKLNENWNRNYSMTQASQPVNSKPSKGGNNEK